MAANRLMFLEGFYFTVQLTDLICSTAKIQGLSFFLGFSLAMLYDISGWKKSLGEFPLVLSHNFIEQIQCYLSSVHILQRMQKTKIAWKRRPGSRAGDVGYVPWVPGASYCLAKEIMLTKQS